MLILAARCSTASTLPAAVWGGEGGRLTVTETAAVLDLTCASVTLDAPIALRADGTFDAVGTHKTIGGAPPGPEVTPPPPRRVHVSGAVDGSRMTLTLRFEDERTTLDPLVLQRNSEGRLPLCG